MPNSVLSLKFVPIVIAMKLKVVASFSVLEPQTSNIKPQTTTRDGMFYSNRIEQ